MKYLPARIFNGLMYAILNHGYELLAAAAFLIALWAAYRLLANKESA